MQYFRPVEGRILKRFGTDTFIGASIAFTAPPKGSKRAPRSNGYKQNLALVVPISDLEYRKYRREYLNAVRRGDLKTATEEDYTKFVKGEDKAAVAAGKVAKKAREATSADKGSSQGA